MKSFWKILHFHVVFNRFVFVWFEKYDHVENTKFYIHFHRFIRKRQNNFEKSCIFTPCSIDLSSCNSKNATILKIHKFSLIFTNLFENGWVIFYNFVFARCDQSICFLMIRKKLMRWNCKKFGRFFTHSTFELVSQSTHFGGIWQLHLTGK